MIKQESRMKMKESKFLLKEAKRLGASEAKVIRSHQVVVEDRVVLKCKSGCHMYGHKFVCPPFAPTPNEFRKMLKEYAHVLIIKFSTKAQAEDDVGSSLLKNQYASDRMVLAVAARAVQPLQIKALHWSDMEPSDLTRTNVNLRVLREMAMIFDKL